MIIKTLVENTSASEHLGCEHGLSLYIEANGKKILFDVGASALFSENAQKLGVNISDVEYLVISHGHYDHGGGLRTFLDQNKTAEVFLHRLAFEKYQTKRPDGQIGYIGLERELMQNRQIIPTSDRFFIGKGIQVFSNIAQKEPRPVANGGLLVEQDGKTAEDIFAHEQNLILEEDGATLLITGCAHNGIVNILEHFHSIKGRMPDYVIGGFHLSSRSGGNESADEVEKIGRYLLGTKAQYYTCHCTGVEAYHQLKAVMGDRIDYLPTGRQIAI